MEKLIDLTESLIGIFGAIWGVLYYTGRLGYSGRAEERRKERVRKYGWLIVIFIVLMSAGGSVLLLLTLINYK